MIKPKAAILTTDGTNCDEETFFAYVLAGGEPKYVHVNQLIDKQDKLDNYQILVIPGGFSYGDDVLSAKILANQLMTQLGESINKFIKEDKLIMGICNGFQALVRMGLLPWVMKPAEDVSLIFNDSGKFECRWIKMKVNQSKCVFTKGLDDLVVQMPVAHGEGKLIVKNAKVKNKMSADKLIALEYVNEDGKPTMNYPDNPNGSTNSIAGMCDKTGRIFGLMPHPERYVVKTQHPNWRRNGINIPDGLPFFQNAVDYFL